MSFFAVPLSGLNASQSALQSVSSNLSNVNTDGYKDQNVTFSDIFAETGITNGALDPLQTGGGVATASTTSNFTTQAASATGISSNMALDGNGFFVVQQTNGTVAYSRAGDFTTNKAGQLVAPDGSLVLGYPAKNGVVDTAAPLGPLNTATGLTTTPVASTQFTANVNLDATSAVGTVVASPIHVTDSLGQVQNLTVNYTKTGANTWTYAVTVPSSSLASPTDKTQPTQTVTAKSNANPAGPGDGNITFDQSGNLTYPVVTTTDASGKTTSAPATIAISIPGLADGAAPMNLNWNLAGASGASTLTQADLPSGTSSQNANGGAAGTLSGYSVEADGTIQGTFSNGATLALGQVAVATVANTQGLAQVGNNLFQVTAGSGQANVGIAGTGGRATIQGGSVEGSNVNVANEFSKMIVAQQAYQANAKVVTTFNQVEQATIAMLQG